MSLADIVNVLEQYKGANPLNPPATTQQDFDKVAQSAPQPHMASAISAALQSDHTPDFPQAVSNLYNQSDPNQRAGILNQLLASAGPAAGGLLANILGSSGAGATQVTPQQASQVSPQVVQQVAQHAQTNNPSIIDQASSFYAQHPKLVQALGVGALAVIMSHISKNQ